MGSENNLKRILVGLCALLLATWPHGSMASDLPESKNRWRNALHARADATKERLQGLKASERGSHRHRGLQSLEILEHPRSAALSCNSKHTKMLDGESKFVFMAKDVENLNTSIMAEQSICARPTMVSNVWATKREVTCFHADGSEMPCKDFCQDQYPVIGVPTVRPSVDDLEACIENPNWSECRSVEIFSEIFNQDCNPTHSAGWIEVTGHFTVSCCEPAGLILPWKSRKCTLPFHLTTLPPSKLHVKALDSCQPTLKLDWKRPPMDHKCPVEIEKYAISCNSLSNSVTQYASGTDSSAEVSVVPNEKYLCSIKSVSDAGESRAVHSRPVIYRYPQKCLPSAPTDVKTQFDGSLEQNTRKVMWSPAFSPESPVLEYHVSCVSGAMESSEVVSGDSYSAIVSGLELGSNVYTCTVVATTAAGSGPTSLPSEPFATPDIFALEKYPTTPSNASFEVWLVDRFEPAVWEKISYEGKTDVLMAGVDKIDVDTTLSFYNNQGRQYRFNESININDTIVQSGSMYIPSSWSVVDLSDSNTWKTATFWSSLYAPPGQSGQGPFSVVGFKNAPFKGLANSEDQDESSNYIQFVAWDPSFGRYWAVDPTDFPVLFDQWNDFVVKMTIKEADPSSSPSRMISYQYYINGDLVAEFPDNPLVDGLTDLVFLINTVNACSGFSNYNEAVCDKTLPANSCCTGSTYNSYRTLDAYIIRG